MASRSESSVFLERRSYRRRRLMDVVKMLPIVGLWLFALPLFWTAGDTQPSTAQAMFYMFAVWFGLSVACGVLVSVSRRLQSRNEPR